MESGCGRYTIQSTLFMWIGFLRRSELINSDMNHFTPDKLTVSMI
jgi:hypothetical protein